MGRTLKSVPENVDASRPDVPKTRAKKTKEKKAVFRSPHPGLEVMIENSERTDFGAGQYSLSSPVFAKFENMGNYGECECDEEMAAVLRQKALEREEQKLPKKYVEV